MVNPNSFFALTGFHDAKMSFLEPQFDLKNAFTEKAIEMARLGWLGKIGMFTVGSAGFGVAMGVVMGGFEFNMHIGTDTTRGGWSVVR